MRSEPKVVDDLVYTGCATEAGTIERHSLPPDLENGTGTKLKTDGRIAVLRIGECVEPRVMPGVGASERTNIFRQLIGSLRTELVHSNVVSLAYSGVRLTSTIWKLPFARAVADDTGAALTRQQLEWLDENRLTAKPAVPSEASSAPSSADRNEATRSGPALEQ